MKAKPQKKAARATGESRARRAAYLASYAAIRANLVRDGRAATESGKSALADALATALMQLEVLRERAAGGALSREDSRMMPGLISTVRRLARDLGIVVAAEPGSDPEPKDEL